MLVLQKTMPVAVPLQEERIFCPGKRRLDGTAFHSPQNHHTSECGELCPHILSVGKCSSSTASLPPGCFSAKQLVRSPVRGHAGSSRCWETLEVADAASQPVADHLAGICPSANG